MVTSSQVLSASAAFASLASSSYTSTQVGVRSWSILDVDGMLRDLARDVAEIGRLVPKQPEPDPIVVPVSQFKDITITAYTSSVEECDSDPFITADGSVTADGIIAANFLPFGTKVRIPTLFGDKVFEVHDRMNARYWYRIDIWMEKKQDMRQFGIKRKVVVEVLEMGSGKTRWNDPIAKEERRAVAQR